MALQTSKTPSLNMGPEGVTVTSIHLLKTVISLVAERGKNRVDCDGPVEHKRKQNLDNSHLPRTHVNLMP